MEVTIDSLGRILIPKTVRKRLGLKPKDRLELEVDETGLRLEPREEASEIRLVRDEATGLLIIHGGEPICDWAELKRRDRNDHLDRVAKRTGT